MLKLIEIDEDSLQSPRSSLGETHTRKASGLGLKTGEMAGSWQGRLLGLPLLESGHCAGLRGLSRCIPNTEPWVSFLPLRACVHLKESFLSPLKPQLEEKQPSQGELHQPSEALPLKCVLCTDRGTAPLRWVLCSQFSCLRVREELESAHLRSKQEENIKEKDQN